MGRVAATREDERGGEWGGVEWGFVGLHGVVLGGGRRKGGDWLAGGTPPPSPSTTTSACLRAAL